VGAAGSIRFGASEKEVGLDPYGHRDGGIVLDRFDELAEVASKLIDKAPAICVFLKPRMSGPHYLKELSDRAVITWDLTEPFGSLLDFTWFNTINRFQAVLHRDGSLEMSYKELTAKDAIVGIYPTSSVKPAAVHFSSLKRKDGPFAVVYESFHYLAPPLQTRVAFPYSLPTEASTMGGGVWQDNFDGSYTQLRDFFFVPATGYSYLDLYLMGLISAAEVPDFFVLQNFTRVGKDAKGHTTFKAERTKVTIQDVIAAEGPRSPGVDHSQRKFNTGFVVAVEHGQSPSHELMERANGIRQQWIQYWETTTGHRASMITNPR